VELGAHAYDVLKGAGVQFVDDVTLLSAEELAALPNMNRKVLDEIVDALAAVGLSLTVVLKG
jgi:DNA-directed RNA polymerase alpha subunit